MRNVLPEENGIYGVDHTNAIWATNEIQKTYHNAKLHLKNADFVIETQFEILIMEYKNATIASAVSPKAFHPMEDKSVNAIALKFYGSLPYLDLLGKDKPRRYIYVIEAEHSDSTMRARLRNRIKQELPFMLQDNMNTGKRLIEGFDVLSIDEWNMHEKYSRYPLVEINEDESC